MTLKSHASKSKNVGKEWWVGSFWEFGHKFYVNQGRAWPYRLQVLSALKKQLFSRFYSLVKSLMRARLMVERRVIYELIKNSKKWKHFSFLWPGLFPRHFFWWKADHCSDSQEGGGEEHHGKYFHTKTDNLLENVCFQSVREMNGAEMLYTLTVEGCDIVCVQKFKKL